MEKEQNTEQLKGILRNFDSEFRAQGIELVLVVCSSEEEDTTFVIANPTLNEIEQRVLAEKVIPAVMEAGKVLWGQAVGEKGNA